MYPRSLPNAISSYFGVCRKHTSIGYSRYVYVWFLVAWLNYCRFNHHDELQSTQNSCKGYTRHFVYTSK